MPVIAVHAVSPEPLEWQQKAANLIWREMRSGVYHRDSCPSRLGLRGYLDMTSGNVVAHGVVHEVGDKPLDQPRVATGRGRVQVASQFDSAAYRVRFPGQDCVFGHGGEVDVVAPFGSGLAARQGQERLDQSLLLSG